MAIYFNMRNILLVYLLMVVVNSKLIGYISRCPTQTERRLLGSHRSCLNNAVYHCIRDERNELVETCNEPKLIPRGNFPIYLHKSDKIFYRSCTKHLYQPFPVWSSEISDCEYKKSACNGIGQIICYIGNAKEDATCGCDYKKGYIINSKKKCCSPSLSGDCNCQYRSCGNHLQVLDKDFKCINMCLPGYERSEQNTCEPKSNTTWSPPRVDVTTARATILQSVKTNREYQFTRPSDYQSNALDFSAVVAYMLLLNFSIYIFVLSKRLFGCLNYLLWLGFLILLSFVAGVVLGLHKFHEVSFAYVLAFLVIVFVCTTCYFVHFLYVYEMIHDPEVYNEEYDQRIFALLKAASRGDLYEIKRLRLEDYIDMDDVDINGRSALHLAACTNQGKTVKYIVENCVCFQEAKDRWNRSAEDDAKWHQTQCLNFESYRYTLAILTSFRDRQYKRRKWKKKKFFIESKATELVTAAIKDDIRTIKRLYEIGNDMNLSNSGGRTALHAAVENKSKHVVEYLIDVCAVSPFVRWRGRRPIDILLTDGQEAQETMINKLKCYMSYLLKFNPEDVLVEEEIPSQDMMIVRLLNCASRGDIKKIERFEASGYQMDLCNYDFQTALHIAVMENQEHIVEFLLKKCNQTEIALKATDRWGITPWKAAKKFALQSVKYVFYENCPETFEEENDDIKTFNLLNAARSGYLPTLKSLHQENVDMNQKDHNGKTALNLAAKANMKQAVKFLVHVAKVDILISDRYNKLQMDGDVHEDIKDILKIQQNDTQEHNKLKMSTHEDTLVLVMKACTKGILHKQTDPRYKYFNMDSCYFNGDTPLHVAAANGNLKDVMYLLDKKKACLFVRNSFWKKPIDVVEENILFLKKRNIQPCNETMIEQLNRIKDLIGNATHKAMDQHTDIDKDASFEKRSKEERLFLFQIRVFRGDILAIRRFLKTDATLINQLDYDDRSALHIAAAAGHTHLVEFLLNQEADKNKKDRYNMTPLDEAKMNGDDKMIHMLKG